MGCYQSTLCIDSSSIATNHRTVGRRLTDTTAMACGLDLGFSLSTSLQRRLRLRRCGDDCEVENNQSWLLGGSGTEVLEAEPELRTVRSSFRFSFGSASEAEEMLGVPTSSAATTVLLLVSLEDDGEGGRKGDVQQQWRKLDYLERSISSSTNGKLVRFSFAEIRSATRGFAKGRELGESALSRVYKGRIGVSRRAVAIKRVDGKDKEGVKDFCRELVIASSLRNQNVVPLIGFCVDNEGLFLVYTYLSGGSLDKHLHEQDKKRKPKVLLWKVRYKVAMGIARALDYLHFGNDKCIIHRDIKPSNILLSSKKSPKLCDFGLATWAHGPSLPFLCKSIKGTFGYLAPEYFQHGKLSDKTDVYAFGVVLLELITGRKAIDRDRPQGEENLVLWAKPFLQQGEEAILKLVDPRLGPGCYNQSEMIHMACAAAACVNSEESRRPDIRQVMVMLQTGDFCSTDWSFFMGSSYLTRNGSQSHEPIVRSDMRGHLALAMLGVSDNEGDESYRR